MDSQRIAAEQALLGAVLLDPVGQQGVLGFVEADDFLRAWHAQVFEAMRRLRGRGCLPGPQEVYAELTNDPDLPRNVALNGVLVADLMAAAARSGHASAYLAAVVESGIRQRLWIAGSRVAQAASSGDLRYASDQAAEASWEVRASLPESWRREFPRPVSDQQASPEAAGHDQACGGGVARPRGPAAEAAGIRLLRDLVASPGQIAGVRYWLRPEHFAMRRHGEIYVLMRDMDSAGMAVDPVTVSREAARRMLRAEHRELTGGTGVFAQASARDLYAMGVLAQIGRAGAGVQADAAGARRNMSAVLDAAAFRVSCPAGRWHPEPWNCAQPESGPATEQVPPTGPETRARKAAIRLHELCQLEREAVP